MELTLILLKQIMMMLVILSIGILCRKRNILHEPIYKDLATLLLRVVNPLLVFVTLQQPLDPQRLRGLLIAIALSFAGMTIMILLAKLLIRKKNNPVYRIERFCATYPNCAYIGIPLVGGVFGEEGVFYLTGTILVFNLMLWTHGLLQVRHDEQRTTPKQMVRRMLNPVVVSALLGFTFYVTNISLPHVLLDGMRYVGNMNTPLAMLIAGGILAQTNFKKILKNYRIYYIAFLKLLLFPAVLITVFYWLPIEHTIVMSVMLALGGSTATACAALALVYDREPLYASEIFAVTTVSTMITLPAVMMLDHLLGYLFS